MNFEHTEDRRMLADTLNRFVAEQYDAPPVGPQGAAYAAAKYFNLRKTSIYGGSNEIQRNIISKMILGL